MKRRKLTFGLAVAMMAMGFQSCGGSVRPENNNGHNLWLGDITISVNQGKAVWQTECDKIDKKSLGIDEIGVDVSGIYNKALGDEGFSISCTGKHVAVTANTDAARLYAMFYLKRMADCGERIGDKFLVTEVPAFKYRVLNHWDNPNLTVERGYAGKSLWKWEELPGKIRPEYEICHMSCLKAMANVVHMGIHG